MAKDLRTGGCRCGAIRYEVTGPPVASVACHCRDCQYVSGGGANYAMVFHRSGFTVLKAAPPWHRPHDGARQIAENVA
jgi:hypothetical protein